MARSRQNAAGSSPRARASSETYRRVDTRVWNDREFLSLSDDGKILWLFLLTAPASTQIPGVIVGGPAALAEQLGWNVERFREGFTELFAKGLCVRLETGVRLVWLPNALRRWKPENPNQVKWWSTAWRDVPECEMKHDIWRALKDACAQWSELFTERFPEPRRNGSGNGYCNKEKEKEKEIYTSQPSAADVQISEPDAPATAQVKGIGKRAADLATRIWFDHCDRHELLKAAIRSSLPGLTKTESAMGWRDLRERIRTFGDDLAAAEGTCRYVLEVRHKEARDSQSLKWFGEQVWTEKQFSLARDREVTLPAGTPGVVIDESDPMDDIRWPDLVGAEA